MWTTSGRARRIERTSAANTSGSIDVRIRIRSTGTPSLLEAVRELRRAGLVLVEHHEADVVAARAEGGEESRRWFSEPEIPATFAT